MRKKRILSISLAWILIAAAQELLFRLVFPVPEVLDFNRINYTNTLLHTSEDPPHLSNSSFTWSSEPDGAGFVHKLNLYGFRDKDWKLKKDKSRPRVMFIGDSFVEGFMSPDEGTIPNGFSKEAARNGHPYETLNLGIGASYIQLYFELVRDAVPLFRPDHLILVFYANDFPTAEFNPAWLSNARDPLPVQPSKPRMLHLIGQFRQGRTIARAWHSPPQPFVPPIPSPLNPWSEEAFRKQVEAFVSPPIAEAMMKGSFNPYAADSYGVMERTLPVPSIVRPHLEALLAYTKRHSTRLHLAYLPSGHQVSDAYLPYHSEYSTNKTPTSLQGPRYQHHALTLGQECEKLNIPFLDLTPLLRKHESGGERLYWDYDEHMRENGYLLAGKYIQNWFTSLQTGTPGNP